VFLLEVSQFVKVYGASEPAQIRILPSASFYRFATNETGTRLVRRSVQLFQVLTINYSSKRQ
jgi:hypothetical protein